MPNCIKFKFLLSPTVAITAVLVAVVVLKSFVPNVFSKYPLPFSSYHPELCAISTVAIYIPALGAPARHPCSPLAGMSSNKGSNS